MKNVIFSTFAFALLLISNTISGQSRTISNFSSIKVSTNVSVKLVHASSPKIEYKMIKGSEDDLITEVSGSQLIVKIQSKRSGWSSKKSQAKVIVYYTDLTDISVAAGASILSDGTIRCSSMDIDVSSGASADIEVTTSDVDAEASSGATLRIKGTTDKADFDASSGSSIKAVDLVADHVKVDASSGASVAVQANKTINADASSGASIKYTGEAENKNIDQGWSGQIKRIK